MTGSRVDDAFSALDEALNLDPSERKKAQKRHNEIRDVLRSADLIMGAFLQGSFARKTMLPPLKDVDTVNLLVDRLREELKGRGGVQRAFDLFQHAVGKAWPDALFDAGDEPPAGKALRVSFPDCDFTIDLVAAFDTDTEVVEIGDRDTDTWHPSRTRIMNRLISERNQATDGVFVHQVRMLKTLKLVHEKLAFTKGILYETLAYYAVQGQLPHKHAVTDVLKWAHWMVASKVLDPTGENDLTEKWTPAERRTAVREFSRLAAMAIEALQLEAAGDQDAALDVWRQVMGSDEFKPVTRPPEEVLAAWHTGSVSSSGRPSTTGVGAVGSTPGRGWLSY